MRKQGVALTPQLRRAAEAAERLLTAVPPRSGAERAAPALRGSSEDACLLYTHGVSGTRWAAGAAADRTVNAMLRACIGHDAPSCVADVVQSGLPRTFTCRRAGENEELGIALDDWPAAVLIKPRYGLVTTLEAAGMVCGALVMFRCRTGRRAYTEFDLDVFRLVGLHLPARLQL